jgi:hypothetical protein
MGRRRDLLRRERAKAVADAPVRPEAPWATELVNELLERRAAAIQASAPAPKPRAGRPAKSDHLVHPALTPPPARVRPDFAQLELAAQRRDHERTALRDADQALAAAVRQVRDGGATWGEIGRRLGVSRQAARQRYGIATAGARVAGT